MSTPARRTGNVRRKRRGEPDRRGTTWECWEEPGQLTLFPSTNTVARKLLTKKAKLLYKFRARSRAAAMKEHHKRQGWETYKPF